MAVEKWRKCSETPGRGNREKLAKSLGFWLYGDKHRGFGEPLPWPSASRYPYRGLEGLSGTVLPLAADPWSTTAEDIYSAHRLGFLWPFAPVCFLPHT